MLPKSDIDTARDSGVLTDGEAPKGVKAVIFDLGNVLLDFDHRLAAARLSVFTARGAEEIYNLFFDSELTALFEEGKITPQQFFLKVKEALALEIGFDEFLPIWDEIFFFNEKNLGVYSLALALKKHYKVAVLSNLNILHFEYIKRTFPIFNSLQIMASFELGLRKPQGQIYQKALDMLGVFPQEAFYTDDRIELIAGARELGIKGFVFSGVLQLRQDLLDAGVKIL